jgi:epoxyqueuosine reductase
MPDGVDPVLETPSFSREWRERVRADLLDLGFDVVRFTDVSAVPAERLDQWIDEGMHADMDWIARGREKRLAPGLVLPGAAAVITLGVNYLPRSEAAEDRPVWARYAQWADYHDTLLEGLKRAGSLLERAGVRPGSHRYYVDTGPLLERGWAARAGMGFLGKNGMLISHGHGNWLFLSAILVAARVEPDPPLGADRAFDADGGARVGLHCGKCTRCLDACPTDALPRPGVVDARRCISYHTIENKGIIPRELRTAFGARIYGCDTCLEVCPWNRFAQASRSLLLEARSHGELSLEEILHLTPETFAERFRGTAVKRLKLRGLLRNACIVAANLRRTDLLPRILELCTHTEPVVRAHAVWAAASLDPAGVRELLRGLAARETSPEVLAELFAVETLT